MSIKDIYTYLLNLPHHEDWDSGLNGRSAVALFFFYYYRLSDDIQAYNKGIDLLEYELNSLENIKNTGLHNGLSGIAWIINHLSYENIIEIDNDEFLPDLLETELKNFFFIHDKLISEEHFELNTNILFYFIERFLTTKSESLRQEYEIFISQGLILFMHFFYQLEDRPVNFDIKILNQFIKTLNLLIDHLKLPLLDPLLSKTLEWIMKDENIKRHNIDYSHILKSSLYLNNDKFYKKIKKMNSKNDFENISSKLGIWENGYSYFGLKFIFNEKDFQNSSLKYFLD